MVGLFLSFSIHWSSSVISYRFVPKNESSCTIECALIILFFKHTHTHLLVPRKLIESMHRKTKHQNEIDFDSQFRFMISTLNADRMRAKCAMLSARGYDFLIISFGCADGFHSGCDVAFDAHVPIVVCTKYWKCTCTGPRTEHNFAK